MAFGFGGSGFPRPNRKKNMAMLGLAAALIVAIAAVGFLSSELASTHDLLANLSRSYNASQAELASVQTNLSYINTNMKVALTMVQDQNSTIADLNTQLSALQNEQSQSSSQTSSLNSTVASLRAQIAFQNSTIAAFQNETAALQNITSMDNTTIEVDSKQFNQTPSTNTTLAGFYAPYAGYLSISGTTNTTYARITVYDAGVTQQSAFNFTSGSTYIIPVIPGTVTVSMYNQNSTLNLASTMTVEYTN